MAEEFLQRTWAEIDLDALALAFGLYPCFRLPDGTVWSFAREELEGFIQEKEAADKAYIPDF